MTFSAMVWSDPKRLAWLGDVVSDAGVTRERDIAYGPLPRQKLDIYFPRGERGAGPVVIFLYGGTWRMGDRAMYGFVGAALAARGITTVIPDYRLYPEARFPAFMVDTALAYAWVATHVAGGCASPRPVILAGHSAGAHMAALLALDTSYLDQAATGLPKPSGVIGLAGPYTFQPTTWDGTREIFATTADAPDKPRPITFAGPHAPPMLLMYGLADTLVEDTNQRELAAALTANGTTVKTFEFDGLGHLGIVLALARPFRWRAPVLDEMVTFAKSLPARPC